MCVCVSSTKVVLIANATLSWQGSHVFGFIAIPRTIKRESTTVLPLIGLFHKHTHISSLQKLWLAIARIITVHSMCVVRALYIWPSLQIIPPFDLTYIMIIILYNFHSKECDMCIVYLYHHHDVLQFVLFVCCMWHSVIFYLLIVNYSYNYMCQLIINP